MGKRRQKKRSFKDSISRAFLSYAAAPLAVLAAAGILAMGVMMASNVMRSNREYNDSIAKLWEELETAYSRELLEFCSDEQVIACSSLLHTDTRLAQQLYDFRESSPVPGHFFWLGAQGEALAANVGTLPDYLCSAYMPVVSITNKIRGNPEEISVSVEYASDGGGSVFCMGRGICRDGVLQGMLIFETAEADFYNAFRKMNGVEYIITNSYGQALWYSNDMFITMYGKILSELADGGDFVPVMDLWMYVRVTPVLDGFLKIYTVTEVSQYIRVLETVAVTFGLVFLLLLLFIYLASGIIAARQTRSVSRIVEAMDGVNYEKLGIPLELRTGDELEDIAVSYNKMKEDMKRLLARNEEIARQNVLSEMKQLELQLEPHFLYNTLELIRFMAKINPDQVGRVISALGVLLRQSIDMSGSMLTVGEEIEFCRNYLLIQKYRFGNKLQYSLVVEERTEGCRIPKRIIQPLVENALKHGGDENGCCHIEVRVFIEGENLRIRVSDEGSGLGGEARQKLLYMLAQPKNDSGHTGLYNIHRRVALIYGEPYGIRIESGSAGAVFCVDIPLEKGEENV